MSPPIATALQNLLLHLAPNPNVAGFTELFPLNAANPSVVQRAPAKALRSFLAVNHVESVGVGSVKPARQTPRAPIRE